MFIKMAANTALLLKPAASTVFSAMMLYLFGYLNISKIIKPKNRIVGVAAGVCKASSKLFLIWLFMKQFIFADINIPRFAGSGWLPLIKAIFR